MTTWQPIETAPRDGVMVDLWTEYWGRIANCRWDQGKWWHLRKGHEESELGATHWQPLPAPPDA